MKNRIFFVFIVVLLLSFYTKASASELCSSKGYTILTVNGIFTDKEEAGENKRALQDKILEFYPAFIFKNELLTVDFLYNPTHLAGAGDLIDVVAQGFFDEKSDYDLTEMLNDASQKVTTQKVLLVAHSQGNFYANNFYDKVASKQGGIPKESISVYSVATPADRVAGGGKYLTSDTDSVIASTVSRFIYILKPNIHIPLQKIDGNGHSFSDVYLKYQGDRIISDIKSSLDNLKENDEQNSFEPCISQPKLTALHEIKGVLFAVADPTVNVLRSGLIGTYNAGSYLADNGARAFSFLFKNGFSLAKRVGNFASSSVASVFSSSETNDITNENTLLENEVETLQPVLVIDEIPEIIPDTTTEIPLNITPEITEVITEPVIQIETNSPVVFSGGGGGSSPINNIDTTPPDITINGNNSEVILKNSAYIDAGASAVNNVDGSITVTTSGISEINTAVLGTYIITYSATDLSGNISTKTRTVIVSDGAKLDNPKSSFISGDYAYVVSENSNSLEIIDISNPARLVHKSSAIHRVDGFEMFAPKAVAVSLNYAYVVSNSNALEIIDISNPNQPIHKSTLYNGDGGVQLIRPAKITISGNYAYISVHGSQIVEIVDISDPVNPTHKGFYYINSLTYPVDTYVLGNYMYVVFGIIGSSEGGLHIVDISNKSAPTLKGSINNGTDGASISNPQSIYISGNYAYITSREDNGIEIIDISNPENPIHKSFIKNEDGGANLHVPISVFVSGNHAYVALFNGSALEVIDVSNPSLPIHKATLPNKITGASIDYATSLFISGNYAYITSSTDDTFEVVNISNPLLPVHAGKISNGEMIHITDSVIFSSEKKIASFDFTDLSPDVIGVIDETNHTISLAVPDGTNVRVLAPTFTISNNATTIPTLGESKDFTNPRNYLVFAEDGSTQNYIVTVNILPPPIDTTPPSITSYTFNGLAQDVTVNPTKLNPLSIIIKTSESVDWTSIKLEKIDDDKIYKYFYPGIDCDKKNTCTENWDGLLAGGSQAPEGTYKIKVKIKDLSGNVFDDYISPYVIKLDNSI